MATYVSRQGSMIGDTLRQLPVSAARAKVSRGSAVGWLMLSALVAFEVFNFSTTEFALGDLLGDLGTAGIRWATVLALAFCAMDFAGLARLLTPLRGVSHTVERGYLVGAWALAAGMNAVLTWYAVSLALLTHSGLGSEVLGREALMRGVPVFVALLVLLVRVLIIGSFSLSGSRLFSQGDSSTALLRPTSRRPGGETHGEAAPHSLRPVPPSAGPVRTTPVVQRMSARPNQGPQ